MQFVTSDYNLVETEALVLFGPEKAVISATKASHNLSGLDKETNRQISDHFVTIKDCKRDVKSIVDFFLLFALISDYKKIQNFSEFSYLIQMFDDVYKIRKNKKEQKI